MADPYAALLTEAERAARAEASSRQFAYAPSRSTAQNDLNKYVGQNAPEEERRRRAFQIAIDAFRNQQGRDPTSADDFKYTANQATKYFQADHDNLAIAKASIIANAKAGAYRQMDSAVPSPENEMALRNREQIVPEEQTVLHDVIRDSNLSDDEVIDALQGRYSDNVQMLMSERARPSTPNKIEGSKVDAVFKAVRAPVAGLAGTQVAKAREIKDRTETMSEQPLFEGEKEPLLAGVPMIRGIVANEDRNRQRTKKLASGDTQPIKDTWEAAKTAATGEGNTKNDVSTFLMERRREIIDQHATAIDWIRAEEEVTGAPVGEKRGDPSEVEDKVLEYALERVPEEKADLLLKHPFITQFGAELVADPLNWVNPFAIAGKIGKATGAAKLYHALASTKTGRTVRGAFRHAPELDDLATEVGSAGETAASAMRAAPAEAQYDVGQGVQELRKGPLQNLKDMNLTEYENWLLTTHYEKGNAKFFEQDTAMAKRLNEAKKHLDQLSNQRHNLRTKFGKGQDWDEAGNLESAQAQKNYIPRTGEGTEVLNKAADDAPDAYKDIKDRSDFERVAKDSSQDVNPANRWEKSLETFAKKSELSKTLKNYGAALEKNGLVAKYTREGAEDLQTSPKLRQTLDELQNSTGTEWTYFQGDKNDLFQRAAGKPGEFNIKKDVTLLPRYVADSLEPLVVAGVMKDSGRAAKFAGEVANILNRSFAKLATAPFGMFAEVNVIGDQAVIHTALGQDAFLSGAQARGALATAAAMKWAPDKIKKIQVNLRGGREVPISDVVEAAKKVGLSTPDDWAEEALLRRMQKPTAELPRHPLLKGLAQGTDKVTEGLQKLGKGLDTATKFTPWAATARAADEHAKFTIFMHFLDDIKPDSIRKAADKTFELVPQLSRLGTLEQKFLLNHVAFYGWLRYGVKRSKDLTKTLGVVTPYASGQRAYEAKEGSNAPYGAEGVPDWRKERSVTGSFNLQPKAQQDRILAAHDYFIKKGVIGKDGKLNPTASHEFIMETPEFSPIFMALPALEEAYGNVNLDTIKKHLFPTIAASLDSMFTDKEFLPKAKDVVGMGSQDGLERRESYLNAKNSGLGDIVKGTVERPFDHYKRIIDILKADDPLTAFDFATRMKAANGLNQLEVAAIEAVKGQNIFPDRKPGTRLGIVNPVIESNRRVERAVESSEEEEQSKRRH